MAPENRSRWGLAPLFFAAGGVALAAQFSLLRELMVALQGDEAAIAVGLSAWLAGIAAGAAVARLPGRFSPGRWAGLGFLLLSAAGPVEVLTARLGRWLLAPPPGELLSLGPAVLLAAAVLAPPGALVGFTFTLLAAAAPGAGWRAGQGIAALYVLESLGSLAGGLLVTFVVVPLLTPLQGILLSAGFWLLVGSAAARRGAIPWRRALPICGLALAALALPFLSRPLEEATVKARFRGLAPGIPLRAWVDTPYQHVAVGGDATRHLYTGGQYAGSFPDPSEEEARAQQLLSLTPRPESILLLGAGFAGPLRFLLRGPVSRIDLVEIDPRALRLVRASLPPDYEAALRDPRVRIFTDDPRRFLARRGETYGLILVLEPPPVTLFLARLSTLEFYRLCRARLAPDGVLAIRNDTAPNVLTGETAALGGALWGALEKVFPVVHASPGPDSLLVAGTDPKAATLDPSVLAERFRKRGTASEVFVPELFPILFPPERVAAQEAALRKAAGSVPPSRDERPVSFLHALARRQRIAGSLLAPLLGWAARASPLTLGALALLPSLVLLGSLPLRRDPGGAFSAAAIHAVAVTGACGMTWSLLVLFSYQTRAGALYGRLGLLTALFMLGLAAGGLLLSATTEISPERSRRRLLLTTAAAFFFALAMPGVLRGLGAPALLRPGIPDLVHALLLLASGIITGSLFPVAAGVLLSGREEIRETAGRLEAADHWGAALAALLGGIVTIPVLGLAKTAWLLAALEAAAVAGVLLAIARGRRAAGS